MHRVLISCPATGRAVPTVQRMSAAKFETIAGKFAFRCSCCNDVHHWRKEDAWLEAGPAPIRAGLG